MTVRKEGRVYNEVLLHLRARGADVKDVTVATIGSGFDHIVLQGENTIGEYNHSSKKLVLYSEIIAD